MRLVCVCACEHGGDVQDRPLRRHLFKRSCNPCGREGDGYRLSGHKWWASGAMDPRCAVCIFMGKTDPGAAAHRQQSMVLVPMDARGVRVVRPLTVFGYDDAPHGHAEMLFQVGGRALSDRAGVGAGLPVFWVIVMRYLSCGAGRGLPVCEHVPSGFEH